MLFFVGVLTFLFCVIAVSSNRRDILEQKKEELLRTIKIHCAILPKQWNKEFIDSRMVDEFNEKYSHLVENLRMRAYTEIVPVKNFEEGRSVHLVGSTRLDFEFAEQFAYQVHFFDGFDESCLNKHIYDDSQFSFQRIFDFVILPESLLPTVQSADGVDSEKSPLGHEMPPFFTFRFNTEIAGGNREVVLPVAGYYSSDKDPVSSPLAVWCHFGTLDGIHREMKDFFKKKGVLIGLLLYDLYEFDLPSGDALKTAYEVRDRMSKKSEDEFLPNQDYKLSIDDGFYLHEMEQVGRYIGKEKYHIILFVILSLLSALGMNIAIGISRSRIRTLMRTMGVGKGMLLSFAIVETLFILGISVIFTFIVTKIPALSSYRYVLVASFLYLFVTILVMILNLRRNLLLEVKKHTTE